MQNTNHNEDLQSIMSNLQSNTVFLNRFQTYRKQVVNPRHQTPQEQSVAKPKVSPVEYPSWVSRCDIKWSTGTMLNPIFWKKIQGQNILTGERSVSAPEKSDLTYGSEPVIRLSSE